MIVEGKVAIYSEHILRNISLSPFQEAIRPFPVVSQRQTMMSTR